MNAWEERLRAELRSESEMVTAESLRSLDLSRAAGPASRRPPAVIPPAGEPGRPVRRTWLAAAAAAASVAVIAAAAGIVSHHALVGGQAPGGPGRPVSGVVRGIVALSARDAWAVGSVVVPTDSSNTTSKPLVLHWDGRSWRRVPVPSLPGDSELNSIAGTSADNLWAVGASFDAFQPLILHWDGRTWRRSASAVRAGVLNGVAAASATDAWAVGQTGGREPGDLFLHWNGTVWRQAPGPALKGTLRSVIALSANDAWAVGGDNQNLHIVHWNGTSWTQQHSPDLHTTESDLAAVATTGPGTTWAVGFTGQEHQTVLILRRTSTAWQPVPGPRRGSRGLLTAVAAITPHDAWAAGDDGDGSDALIIHWNGTSWSPAGPRPAFPGGIDALTVISPTNIWAAGYRGSPYAGVPLILHWNGTTWTRSYGPASTAGLNENSSCGPYCPETSPHATPRTS